MNAARTASLKNAPASAAVMTLPGDWPGPALNDFLYLAQMVVAG
jgi:hypothetical protein